MKLEELFEEYGHNSKKILTFETTPQERRQLRERNDEVAIEIEENISKPIHLHYQTEIEKIIEKYEQNKYHRSSNIIEDLQKLIKHNENIFMKITIKITKQEAIEAWKKENNYQNDKEITVEIEENNSFSYIPRRIRPLSMP